MQYTTTNTYPVLPAQAAADAPNLDKKALPYTAAPTAHPPAAATTAAVSNAAASTAASTTKGGVVEVVRVEGGRDPSVLSAYEAFKKYLDSQRQQRMVSASWLKSAYMLGTR